MLSRCNLSQGYNTSVVTTDQGLERVVGVSFGVWVIPSDVSKKGEILRKVKPIHAATDSP